VSITGRYTITAWDEKQYSARRRNKYYYYLLCISDWTKLTIGTFALAETGRGLRPLHGKIHERLAAECCATALRPFRVVFLIVVEVGRGVRRHGRCDD